ncbi:MAG: WG repeat-containing protein [Muribaculaceae bacterium]|nr:WG repeat-containing protein [Muribaculaceae bacterium]
MNRIWFMTIGMVSALCGCVQFVMADDSENLVHRFGELMSLWCESGDDEYRIDIDEIVSGKKGCRVDDGIMRIFVARDTTHLLTRGSAIVDNYLNGFTSSIERGLTYSHGNPTCQKYMVEPTAFSEKEEDPVQFITMDVNTTGDFRYDGTNLFFVRGKQITKIEDFNDDNSLARAIALYSEKRYEEAFRLFRKLAYKNPANFEAQYYTAIMEIKKQGCRYLSPKVRDLEAAWWIVRGVVGNPPPLIKDRMTKLYVRFNIDETPLPFNTFGKSIYLNSIETKQLVSEGLMAYKKKGKYGFLNEEGKTVIPCIYDAVWPFDKKGHALVLKDNMYGYINKVGELIIPNIYEGGLDFFQGNKTMMLREGELYILNDRGEVLDKVGNGFDFIHYHAVNGKVYAHNKDNNLFYVYDMDGKLKSVEKSAYKIDWIDHSYFIVDEDGKKIETDSYGWDNGD